MNFSVDFPFFNCATLFTFIEKEYSHSSGCPGIVMGEWTTHVLTHYLVLSNLCCRFEWGEFSGAWTSSSVSFSFKIHKKYLKLIWAQRRHLRVNDHDCAIFSKMQSGSHMAVYEYEYLCRWRFPYRQGIKNDNERAWGERHWEEDGFYESVL